MFSCFGKIKRYQVGSSWFENFIRQFKKKIKMVKLRTEFKSCKKIERKKKSKIAQTYITKKTLQNT